MTSILMPGLDGLKESVKYPVDSLYIQSWDYGPTDDYFREASYAKGGGFGLGYGDGGGRYGDDAGGGQDPGGYDVGHGVIVVAEAIIVVVAETIIVVLVEAIIVVVVETIIVAEANIVGLNVREPIEVR